MSSFFSMVSTAVLAVIGRPVLIAVHLAGNLVLLLLFYFWLSLSERTAGDLALSAVLTLLIVFGALWLYAASLASFHPGKPKAAFRRGLRRLGRFIPWVVALAAAALLILRWKPARFPFLPWMLCGVVLLALLPLASQGAGGEFTPGAAARILRRPQYWLAGILAVGIGACLPVLLLSWVPEMTGIASQSISMAVRFGLAGLIAVMAWLTLAALVGQLGGDTTL